MALHRRAYLSPARSSTSSSGNIVVTPRNTVVLSCNATKIFRIRVPVLLFVARPFFPHLPK
ncbi:hypothetical protein DUQ00_03235 [Salmonella bongori]|nr:hypothetical protein [Salmonella bongori]ECC9595362.1 hypothetical protein [Salmonella bongori]